MSPTLTFLGQFQCPAAAVMSFPAFLIYMYCTCTCIIKTFTETMKHLFRPIQPSASNIDVDLGR